MVLLMLPYVVQILLILHAVKNGKNTTWIWLLIMVPYVGGIVYFLLEVLPDLRRGRILDPEQLVGLIDKQASVKRLREEIKIANTVANRLALADEYYHLGDYRLAQEAYQAELKGAYSTDVSIRLKVAKSAFLRKDYAVAQEYFKAAFDERPTTSAQLMTWSAYAKWQTTRTAESLAALEAVFESQRTIESGHYLCQAYKDLGNRTAMVRTIDFCEAQLKRLHGDVRRVAQQSVKRMKLDLEELTPAPNTASE